MSTKTEYLIDSILKKLRNNKKKSIIIDKKDFDNFINFLKNNN